MAVPQTLQEFLQVLRASRLWETAFFDQFVQTHHDLPPSATEAARYLLDAKLLTPFQARLLLQGKHRGFALGPYRLLDQIGSGGMGSVYLAEHATLKRRVAIKVLPGERAQDPVAVERFNREARAAASLNHPNIVRAFDVHSEGGVHFLVLEYVEGMSLQRRIKKQGPLPVGLAANFIAQAASGLQHAHERNIIHRDIKPANLIVDQRGVVKILDMGLARFFGDHDDNLTENFDSDAIVGTADYLAPEQTISGKPVDHRADLYSLGGTFHALLLGRPPFGEGNTTQKLLAHQLAEPPRVDGLRRDVPKPVADLIARLLAKRVDDRPITAAHIVVALERYADPPLPAAMVDDARDAVKHWTAMRRQAEVGDASEDVDRNDASGTDLAPPRQRGVLDVEINPLVGLGIGMVLLIAAILAGIFYLNMDAPPTVTPQTKKTPRAPELLHEIHLGQSPMDVTFSPDSKVVYVGCDNGALWGYHVDSGQPHKHRMTIFSNISSVCISDGLNIGLIGYKTGRVSVMDMHGGRRLFTIEGNQGEMWATTMTRDGDRYFLGDASSKIRAYQRNGDAAIKIWEANQGRPIWSLRLSPDEKLLASGGRTPNPNDNLPDTAVPTVFLWDVLTGEEVARMAGHERDVRRVAFSQDGKRLASGGFDGFVCVWDVATGREIKKINAVPGGFVEGVALMGNGKYVVTCANRDGLVVVWDVESGSEHKRYVGHHGKLQACALSPDGRTLATIGTDQTLRLWQAEK
jgi:serine/threonine-protein kinase